MTALFNFQSLLLVIILLVCTSTYVHQIFPAILDRNKDGIMGIFWKCARIGERLSPYVSICCVLMAVQGSDSHSPDDRRIDFLRKAGRTTGVADFDLKGSSTTKQPGDNEDTTGKTEDEDRICSRIPVLYDRLSKPATHHIRPITLGKS
ncbi:hypothetical protein SMACR_08444 [Sordaria macrospora]|uniref:WGS project CABT00000000 data, contig 2.51 n=2 Tax=Sordaria macrospora TaxID=5147 RepID=F7W9E4_SORMK|nr:uncharacterized protein SMAC_08444 [Sordaria macrospora k-hell]KAA8629507.1 hypothetical protein SMACR_08444 [Sordaria macrospora]WPJ64247.1 hypothetical protein SMAC4_08444 [Sordaria macrospora]CCC13935.1 unnamed protein product [Sordaria macrospora k-hell]